MHRPRPESAADRLPDKTAAPSHTTAAARCSWVRREWCKAALVEPVAGAAGADEALQLVGLHPDELIDALIAPYLQALPPQLHRPPCRMARHERLTEVVIRSHLCRGDVDGSKHLMTLRKSTSEESNKRLLLAAEGRAPTAKLVPANGTLRCPQPLSTAVIRILATISSTNTCR